MTRRRSIFGLVIAAALGLLVLALPSVAAAKDRNHDNIPDRWEKRHSLSLKVNQAKRDQDRDKLVNRKEFRAGMDPNDSDSDDDGVEDGDEGAGTITAWDPETGSLTINDLVGGSATAKVTDDTEIECDNGDDNGDEDEDNEGGDEDHQGHGGPGDDDEDDDVGDDDDVDDDVSAAKSGDDEGEQGDEPGDDGEDCTAADLAVGQMVQEADLELESGGFVWDEIEILK